jgi:class 3 adenylate cyclase
VLSARGKALSWSGGSTILFCDVVGSTELSWRPDPADLLNAIGAYGRCMADMVRRFDGFFARYMGDGTLVFGYPQAHEGNAERTVWASRGRSSRPFLAR